MTQDTTKTIRFFYQNLLEDATLSASSQASAELAVANAINYQLEEKWRTNGVLAEYIQGSFTGTQSFNMVGIFGHNYSETAQIRVLIKNGADTTYDSGYTNPAWVTLYGYDEDGYSEHGYDGIPLLSEADGYTRQTIIFLPATYQGDAIFIYVNDPDNSQGYQEAGWIAAGLYFSLDYDFSTGNNEVGSWIDPSYKTKTESGHTLVVKKTKYRVGRYPLDFLSRSEAFNQMTDMVRICGSSRPIVVMPFPDDAALLYRTAMYCLITNATQGIPLSLVRRNRDGYSYAMGIEVEELI